MEKFVSTKKSNKYGFDVGDEFPVLRSIMGECVLIVGNKKKPDIIMNENELRYYGELSGDPAIGGY